MNYKNITWLLILYALGCNTLLSIPFHKQLEPKTYLKDVQSWNVWKLLPMNKNLLFVWKLSKPTAAHIEFFKMDPYGWAKDGGSPRMASRELLEQFASTYKIHIMPKPNKIVEVADRIARYITENNDFEELIEQLKITRGIIDLEDPSYSKDNFFDPNDYLLPFIMIYARPGKAQAVLEHLDRLLSTDYEGVQLKDFPPEARGDLLAYGEKMGKTFSDESYIPPRFNIPAQTRDGQRISNLLYYAQGNADNKGVYMRLEPEDYERIKATVPAHSQVVKRSPHGVHILGLKYIPWFDPTSNGALLYPDYFGTLHDFHLYLPDGTPPAGPAASEPSSRSVPQ